MTLHATVQQPTERLGYVTVARRRRCCCGRIRAGERPGLGLSPLADRCVGSLKLLAASAARSASSAAAAIARAAARGAGALNGCAGRVYLQMNNNRRDYPTTNGIQLKEMLLEDWRPPDRDELIAKLDERRERARRQPKRRGPKAA